MRSQGKNSGHPSKINAIILAAGMGKRMGKPKAELCFRGSPLPLWHAKRLIAAGIDKVHIVLGFNAVRIEKVLSPLPPNVAIIVNPMWEEGQFSSLISGIKSFAPSSLETDHWLLVVPTDMKLVRQATIQNIVAERASDLDAVIPKHKGNSGHPVLLGAPFAASLIAQDPVASRLDLLLRCGKVKRIEIEDDPSILGNLNNDKDLAAYLHEDGVLVTH